MGHNGCGSQILWVTGIVDYYYRSLVFLVTCIACIVGHLYSGSVLLYVISIVGHCYCLSLVLWVTGIAGHCYYGSISQVFWVTGIVSRWDFVG